MTSNTVAYHNAMTNRINAENQNWYNTQSIVETKRANAAREAETHRSNTASEKETNRSNLAREKETNRSNLANEKIKSGTLSETIRSNKRAEAQKDVSLVQEGRKYSESVRHNRATETENSTHNRATEANERYRNVEGTRHNAAMEELGGLELLETATRNDWEKALKEMDILIKQQQTRINETDMRQKPWLTLLNGLARALGGIARG